MPIDLIPDSAHPPFIPLPVPQPPPPPLPRRAILKYLPLPILLISLSISIYAVSIRTGFSSQASNTNCPTYDISNTGFFSSSVPDRKVQITINGQPLGVFPSQNQSLSLPPEGIYTWQVLDEHKCLSSGSYTPTPNPNFDSDLPLLIPTLSP